MPKNQAPQKITESDVRSFLPATAVAVDGTTEAALRKSLAAITATERALSARTADELLTTKIRAGATIVAIYRKRSGDVTTKAEMLQWSTISEAMSFPDAGIPDGWPRAISTMKEDVSAYRCSGYRKAAEQWFTTADGVAYLATNGRLAANVRDVIQVMVRKRADRDETKAAANNLAKAADKAKREKVTSAVAAIAAGTATEAVEKRARPMVGLLGADLRSEIDTFDVATLDALLVYVTARLRAVKSGKVKPIDADDDAVSASLTAKAKAAADRVHAENVKTRPARKRVAA